MWPCVFILMPDRQEKSYKNFMVEWKKASTETLKPKTVLSNFEVEAMSSFEEEFPGVTINGYNFHMSQCIWWKIQQLVLATAYQHDAKLRKWLEFFKGLSFVPLNRVTEAFNYIVYKRPFGAQNEKIELFINYFCSTWLDSSSLFPP